MHQALLDEYALKSPLRYKSNELKLGLAIAALLVGVMSTSPIAPLFIALTMSLSTVILGKIPLKFYIKLVLAPFGFAIFGAVIILFFFGGGGEIFSLTVLDHSLAVRAGGVNMAVLVISRTLCGMCSLFFLALTTPMVELFAILKAARVPDALIELSMMIYRYIFVFLDEALRMRYAQITRLGYSGFRGSIRSFSMLGGSLFLRTWEQGEKICTAMDSRCYDGKLSLFKEKRDIKALEATMTSAYIAFILTLAYMTRDFAIV